MNELTKLLWLVGLIGFGVGLVIMLLRVDRSDEWSKAHIAQLILNRYGEFDISAVAFWVGIGVSILAVVYSLFKPVGNGFIAVFGIFSAQVQTPILFKVIFGRAPPDGTGKNVLPAKIEPALPLKKGDQT